jgi:hypothetical protein
MSRMISSKKIDMMSRLKEEVARLSDQQIKALRSATLRGMTLKEAKQYRERHITRPWS